ncbi:Hypothetical predicted protein [Pelobates cultripes]|uniref:Uncharacterized protein n=1 Tax=Pelobates cultripes TaxID=61616 RepID=A0AAD1SEI6_PELCU|nr:Hypothetical predicted protein [Pelobates cultripes]
MRADFQKLAEDIKWDIQAIGRLEDKMEEADAYTAFQSQLQQMEMKMVDLDITQLFLSLMPEDRVHRMARPNEGATYVCGPGGTAVCGSTIADAPAAGQHTA